MQTRQQGGGRRSKPRNLLGWTLVRMYSREMVWHSFLLLTMVGVR